MVKVNKTASSNKRNSSWRGFFSSWISWLELLINGMQLCHDDVQVHRVVSLISRTVVGWEANKKEVTRIMSWKNWMENEIEKSSFQSEFRWASEKASNNNCERCIKIIFIQHTMTMLGHGEVNLKKFHNEGRKGRNARPWTRNYFL